MDRLTRESFDLKLSHRRELEKAERKAEEAEGRATAARAEQEQRVTSLEARKQ